MNAQVTSLDEYRSAAAARQWERAIELWNVAAAAPSIDNMAAAVDARREFERLFLGKVIT